METFGAIQYVTSGLALLGMLVLVVFYISRRALGQEQKLIESASTERKAQLALRTLEKFVVETTGLSEAGLVKLALSQLAARTERLRIVLRYGAGVIVVLVVAAVLSIVLAAKSPVSAVRGEATPTPTPAPMPMPMPTPPSVNMEDSPGAKVIVGDDSSIGEGSGK